MSHNPHGRKPGQRYDIAVRLEARSLWMRGHGYTEIAKRLELPRWKTVAEWKERGEPDGSSWEKERQEISRFQAQKQAQEEFQRLDERARRLETLDETWLEKAEQALDFWGRKKEIRTVQRSDGSSARVAIVDLGSEDFEGQVNPPATLLKLTEDLFKRNQVRAGKPTDALAVSGMDNLLRQAQQELAAEDESSGKED